MAVQTAMGRRIPSLTASKNTSRFEQYNPAEEGRNHLCFSGLQVQAERQGGEARVRTLKCVLAKPPRLGRLGRVFAPAGKFVVSRAREA